MCGPDAIDTAQALNAQDVGLRDLYNTRAAEIRSALQYDCAVFDKNNTCFTFSGRAISVGGGDSHKIDGSFIGAYRLAPGLRIGGYLTPGFPASTDGYIKAENDVPAFGVFGAWTQHPDGSGGAVHLSGTYETGNVNIGRPVFGSFIPFPFFSEPGRGDATLRSAGASAMFSYGMPLENCLVTPYLGLQATDITRDGYTETSGAIDPLTFQPLTDRQTTATLGVRMRHRISPLTTLQLNGGLEHDFSHSMSANVATGNLLGGPPAPQNFGATYRQTRAGLGVGAGFDVAPLRSVNVSVGYQQEALGAATSLSGIVAYQAGF